MSSNVLNHRLQGWALKLQEFSFDIIYREGKLDSNADALSRQTWTPESPPVHSADSTKDARELSEAGCGNSPTEILVLYVDHKQHYIQQSPP